MNARQLELLHRIETDLAELRASLTGTALPAPIVPTPAALHFDGGSRGNPGPSAIGYVLYVGGDIVFEHAERIGPGTNNVAEYTALIAGLEKALELGIRELEVYGDSTLIVSQVARKWRVRDATLQQLCARVHSLVKRFERFSIEDVPRERNARADLLVNEALDGLR